MSSPANDIPPKVDKSRLLLGAIVAATFALFGAVLILGTASVSHGPRRDRSEAEIAALSAALESYKADHGDYPRDAATDRIRPDTDFDPEAYVPASKLLYRSLAGGTKVYFEFHPSMLRQDSVGEIYVVDPRGNSYGYSTVGVKTGPGFPDLWSTRGGTTASAMSQWVTNW